MQPVNVERRADQVAAQQRVLGGAGDVQVAVEAASQTVQRGQVELFEEAPVALGDGQVQIQLGAGPEVADTRAGMGDLPGPLDPTELGQQLEVAEIEDALAEAGGHGQGIDVGQVEGRAGEVAGQADDRGVGFAAHQHVGRQPA